MARLTTNYMVRGSGNRGAAFKDWSERSKHRTGTLRRSEQVIYAPGSARGHYIANVSRIHTSHHDGKVYGHVNKQLVCRMQEDVWQEVSQRGVA